MKFGRLNACPTLLRKLLIVFAMLPAVFFAGCSRLPETYPPPRQRPSLIVPPSTGLGYFLSMDDPQAGLYLVKDFQDHGPGTWRWAYSHPVMRFMVPDVPHLKFTMDFSLPERTFRDTGPVVLTLSLNGTIFDRHRYEQPGELHYTHDVPEALLRRGAINLVGIDPDPVWVSPADGGRLGFILSRAGFTD
jgi:hypothetical protein